MIDPVRHRQLEELDTVNLCTRILYNSRNELYLNMHFLDISLSSLGFEADPSMRGLGTDGYVICYNPDALLGLYKRGRRYVNRAYLHMVFHCLFCHLDTRGKRAEAYWNLACDIAMESVIDNLHKKCIHVSPSPYRREIYLRLGRQLKVLTAEGIYQALQNMNLTETQYQRLADEFYVDDHDKWTSEPPPGQPIPRQTKWNDNREKMQTEMESTGQDLSEKGEDQSLLEQVQVKNRERYDYKRFLRKFSVTKEELMVDPDSFDYIYYTYGLKMYGNMPLMEPLETKEVRRIEDFVLVIDTSMSCSGELVRRFLEETYSVLKEGESYFKKINVHIIQCDDKVRSDVVITDKNQMEEYMEHFTIEGKGGTDFRPAFEYVNALRAQGRFTGLRGLLYFTDGKGIYPVKMPPYDTAFVFIQGQYEDVSVPVWAIKLILEEEELKEAYEY
ncbi:MAG: metallopeptidase [Hungatella sp.]|jgi:predicted metal-dependent peptidase|nr:metallopeptidase [Hungatella sp.]